MRRKSPVEIFAALFLATAGGALSIALLQPPPASAHADGKAEGAELFATRGCAHCHGLTGEGTDSGPSLRDLRKRMKPKEIEHQIVAGGKSMPAFGDTLDHEQVESLVAFVRAKQWPTAPAAASPLP